MTDIKYAAYVCKGCGIRERLDTDRISSLAEQEGKCAIVRQHEFLCNQNGTELIRKDIEESDVSHVLIAACSRRSKTEAFDIPNVAVSRVNLREGVIWARPDDEENRAATQEMADDYIRMGCAEMKHMQTPAGNTETGTNKRLLVVGGGVSGMTAAVEASKTGYNVLLVEKSGQLGGWVGQWYKRVPFREPYAHPQETGIEDLRKTVEQDSNITVYLHATISRTSGAPGQFSVDISVESGSTHTENVGAIVQATGFSRYDATKLPELGYSTSPDIVDQTGLEELARAADGGPMKRPSDGAEVASVVFVQCAGQRSDKPSHLPYCSGHCCNTSIKQAMYFKQANPAVDTNIIYDDLRTPGNGEDFYRSAQRQGVVFTKGRVETVTATGGGLAVTFKDMILDENATISADLVVLATGQVANSGVDIEPPAETQDETVEQADTEISIPVESVLNLTYRQGPDLPHLKYGFNDSHFICFPYETRRTGIYACGPVRRPMDMVQAMEDATGATLKAIQAVENAGLGRAAHPRSGDLSFPTFRDEGCTQCKRCTVECPFGAIDEDENRYPVFRESRCRRCGTCMGACPVRVISFENYSVDTVGQ
ncbi:MAG: FAD-dependent oxidoreductase, partial [Gammaproteobacteria bacterium]|nr:FAD-dependent oxidoreductase [Gammaproteobacteria bacterium]